MTCQMSLVGFLYRLGIAPNTPPEHKTPDEWQQLFGVEVIDPDGWRIDNHPWGEPLTAEEFLSRSYASTTCDLDVHEGGVVVTYREGHFEKQKQKPTDDPECADCAAYKAQLQAMEDATVVPPDIAELLERIRVLEVDVAALSKHIGRYRDSRATYRKQAMLLAQCLGYKGAGLPEADDWRPCVIRANTRGLKHGGKGQNDAETVHEGNEQRLEKDG